MQIQLLSVKFPKLVVKRKRGNVLTNKSTKSSKTIEANDKGEEYKCPKFNVVKFFKWTCAQYASMKEDIKPMILLKVPK